MEWTSMTSPSTTAAPPAATAVDAADVSLTTGDARDTATTAAAAVMATSPSAAHEFDLPRPLTHKDVHGSAAAAAAGAAQAEHKHSGHSNSHGSSSSNHSDATSTMTTTAAAAALSSLLVFGKHGDHTRRGDDEAALRQYLREHSLSATAAAVLQRELSAYNLHRSESIFSDASASRWRLLNIASFSTVSLTAVWVCNVVGALACFALTEVYQSFYPAYPLDFVLVVACHLNVLSGVLVYVLGRRRYGAQQYHFYQPFVGGQRYVALQMLGIALVVLSVLSAATYVTTFDVARVHRGLVVVLGVLGLAGNGCLWLSLRYFEPYTLTAATADDVNAEQEPLSQQQQQQSTGGQADASVSSQPTLADATAPTWLTRSQQLRSRMRMRNVLALLRTSPNSETGMVVVLMVAQLTLSNVATLLPPLQTFAAYTTWAVQLFNAYVVHVHIGCRHTPGYSFVMVHLQRGLDTAGYWALQLLYVASLVAGGMAAVAMSRRHSSSSGAVVMAAATANNTTAVTLAVATLNALSCGALLLFVRTTSFVASRRASYNTVYAYGGVALVASAAVAGVVSVALMLVMQYYPADNKMITAAAAATAAAPQDGSAYAWSTRAVLTLCLTLAQLFLLALTPSTDVAGSLIHGDDFALFRSHGGSVTSMATHGLGWLLYIVALIGFALFAVTKDVRPCALSTAASTLSVLCMAFAIRAYSADKIQQQQQQQRSDGGVAAVAHDGQPQERQGEDDMTTRQGNTAAAAATTAALLLAQQSGDAALPLRYVVNGEMIISYLLALSSIMMYFVVDAATRRIWGDAELPVEQLLLIANALFLCAVPLAHCSARDKGVRVLQPFSGSGVFVALQALGWMLYTLFAFFALVVAIAALNRGVDVRAVLQLLQQHKLYCSLLGILQMLPMLLITLSITVESRVALRRVYLRALVLDAFYHLRALVHEAIVAADAPPSSSPTAAAAAAGDDNNNDNKNNKAREAALRSSAAQERRAVLQLAFRAIAEPALQYYDLPCTEAMLCVACEDSGKRGSTRDAHTTATRGRAHKSSNAAAAAERGEDEEDEDGDVSSASADRDSLSDDASNSDSDDSVSSSSSSASTIVARRWQQQQVSRLNDSRQASQLPLSRQLSASHQQQQHEQQRRDTTTAMTARAAHRAHARAALTPEQQRTRRRQHELMRVIVILLCCASAIFYVVAAFLSHLIAFALAFAVCGALVCTASCVGIQAGYGMVVHGKSGSYGLFVPFRGGRDYLLWQAAGWVCYTSITLITLGASLETGHVSATALVLAAVLSVLSQVCIFHSIPAFAYSHAQSSFVEQNGEGLVALCAFAGAFVFGYVHSSLEAFFFSPADVTGAGSPLLTTAAAAAAHHRPSSSGGGLAATLVSWLPWLNRVAALRSRERRARLPFVVTMLSLSLAAPCVLLALGRTTRRWRRVARQRARHSFIRRQRLAKTSTSTTQQHGDDAEDKRGEEQEHEQQQQRQRGGGGRRRSDRRRTRSPEITNHLTTVWATYIANMLEVTVVLFGTMVPLSLAYLLYYLTRSFSPSVPAVLERAVQLLAAMAALTLLLSFVPYVASVGVPRFAVTLRMNVVTFVIYGMAVVTMSSVFLPSLLWPRPSTLYNSMCLVVLGIFGSYHHVRVVVRIGIYAMIGYITYRTYVDYTRRSGGGGGSVGSGALATTLRHLAASTTTTAPRRRMLLLSLLLRYVCEVLLMVAWLLYLPRYNGKPYYTGAQRSEWFVRFARRYIFADMARYFHLRIVKDDAQMTLQGSDKQYLFAFHPHGVFAGTALTCTFCDEWQRKMMGGSNSSIINDDEVNNNNNNKSNSVAAPPRYVSTHVASIVFSIPVLRDFNLALGNLSVSRACIEASLQRGNCPLIVVGGQAEMLHSALSTTRMVVITQHIGFVRLAIQNRVPIVPLLSMAEVNVLGLLQFPAIQRIMLKIVGFPFPVIPYGRWGLPLPFRTPLTVVVGSPIAIPDDADANNAADVQRLAEVYFAELRALFYRHRAEAGYPDMELVLVNDKEERARRRAAAQAAANANTPATHDTTRTAADEAAAKKSA